MAYYNIRSYTAYMPILTLYILIFFITHSYIFTTTQSSHCWFTCCTACCTQETEKMVQIVSREISEQSRNIIAFHGYFTVYKYSTIFVSLQEL